MKDALDLRSKSGIHRLITALEERGFIRRLPNRARAPSKEAIKVPESLVAHGMGSGMGAARARGFTPSVIEGNLGRVRTASEDDGGRPVAVPVMGRIAAGTPVEADPDPQPHHQYAAGPSLHRGAFRAGGAWRFHPTRPASSTATSH